MNENTASNMSFCTILFFIFLILKLTDAIDWSWWWITAPLWLPFVLLVPFVFLVACLKVISDERAKKRSRKFND